MQSAGETAFICKMDDRTLTEIFDCLYETYFAGFCPSLYCARMDYGISLAAAAVVRAQRGRLLLFQGRGRVFTLSRRVSEAELN